MMDLIAKRKDIRGISFPAHNFGKDNRSFQQVTSGLKSIQKLFFGGLNIVVITLLGIVPVLSGTLLECIVLVTKS